MQGFLRLGVSMKTTTWDLYKEEREKIECACGCTEVYKIGGEYICEECARKEEIDEKEVA